MHSYAEPLPALANMLSYAYTCPWGWLVSQETR